MSSTKLTLSEHLTKLGLELEKPDLQYLSTKVAKEHRKRYPEEVLKKVYRANHKGKFIAMGLGYDDRVVDIIDKFIQL